MNNEHDIVDRLRSVGGYFDAAALKYVSCSEAADTIESLRQRVKELDDELHACEVKWNDATTCCVMATNELAVLKQEQGEPVKTYCGGKPNYCKEQE